MFLKDGRVYSGRNIKFYIIENGKKINRIGIAVSVKADNAVKRNRIKRLIRENYRLVKGNIKEGYDIVFLWNKNSTIDKMNFETIKKDYIYFLKKADMLIGK